MRRIARVRVVTGALALALSAFAFAKPPGEAPGAEGLTGQLLVATPRMSDPRFARAVIYMVRHDASGALGLVVNRPFKAVSIADLLGRPGLPHQGVSGSMRLHYGGPVEPGRVFVLHTADYRAEGTRVVAGGIALTGPEVVLRAIGAGRGPRRALLVLSYSGWGPGQLEREIQDGAWVSVPADPGLVFDGADDTKWERALARRKIEL